MSKRIHMLIVFGLAVVVLAQFVGLAGGTLRVAKTTDAVSLDPHNASAGPSQEVYVNIYETLTWAAADGTIEPLLATSWERIDDLTMRFHLRENVKFHDGTEFDAAAVKFTVERAIDPDNPARSRGGLGPVEGVKIVDDHTVDVFTSEAYSPLPMSMAHIITIGIVSPTAVEKYGDDFGLHPVGTGPFRFVEWTTNERIVLERFVDYWGEPASLDKIVYSVIPDLQAQHFALESGEIDMLLSPEPARVLYYKNSPKFKVYNTPGLRVMIFGCDMAEGPTADKMVRLAIARAIDEELLCQATLEGTAVPPDSHLAPGYFGYRDVGLRERYAYSCDKAKEILETSGWKDRDGDGLVENTEGDTLKITVYAPEGRYSKDREAAITVQYMLQKAGFDAQLLIEPWATYIASLSKPKLEIGSEKYDLYLIGMATQPDASLILDLFYGGEDMIPQAESGGANWCYFIDERFDNLCDTARSTFDYDERARLYGEALEVMAEEVPSIPYAILEVIVVTSTRVEGYQVHPLDFYQGYFYPVVMEE